MRQKLGRGAEELKNVGSSAGCWELGLTEPHHHLNGQSYQQPRLMQKLHNFRHIFGSTP